MQLLKNGFLEKIETWHVGLSCQYTHFISFSSKSEHDTVADQATLNQRRHLGKNQWRKKSLFQRGQNHFPYFFRRKTCFFPGRHFPGPLCSFMLLPLPLLVSHLPFHNVSFPLFSLPLFSRYVSKNSPVKNVRGVLCSRYPGSEKNSANWLSCRVIRSGMLDMSWRVTSLSLVCDRSFRCSTCCFPKQRNSHSFSENQPMYRKRNFLKISLSLNVTKIT